MSDEQLQQLAQLREQGILSQEMYQEAIARIPTAGATAVGDGATAVGAGGVIVDGPVGGSVIGGEGHTIVIAEKFWQQFNPSPNAEQLRQATNHYLKYLINRYQYLDFKGMGVSDRLPLRLPLVEMYVPLKGRIELPEGETWGHDLRVAGRKLSSEEAESVGRRVSDPLPVLPLLQKHSGLIVLGDPGAGKTTFMKYLALQLASGQGQTVGLDNRLPILLPLSAYANALAQSQSNIPLDKFMANYYRELGITEPLQAMFAEALKQGGCLILLDGLDEVREVALRQTVVKTVESFFAYQQQRGNKFVLTSRIVGYKECRLTGTDMSECTLVDFDEAEIEAFVIRWTNAIERAAHGANEVAQAEAAREKAELMRSVVHNQGVRRLAASPLLLTILALMKRQGVVLPERRVELYDKYTEVLLKQWNLARSLGRTTAYSPDLISTMQLLALLALWMHEVNPGAGLVKEAEMKAKLTTLYREREHENPEQAAADLLTHTREHANLLLERGGREYGFIHLTFQEYLAAVAIAQKGQGKAEMMAADLLPRLSDSNWHEVALLTIGYVGLKQQLPEIAGQILHTMIEEESSADPRSVRALVFAGEALLDSQQEGIDHRNRKKLIEIVAHAVTDSQRYAPKDRAKLGKLLGNLGDPREGVGLKDGLPDIAWGKELPAGTYTIGDGRHDDQAIKNVTISQPYRLAQYPITQAQFAAFEQAQDWDDKRWWQGLPEDEKRFSQPRFPYANHPRETVSWYQAVAFCRWLNAKLAPTGYEISLPTEAEWEAAARSPHGQDYPWGETWDSAKANTEEGKVGSTTAVGSYPQGANTALGLYDMSGNVFEWCLNKYKHPDDTAIDQSNDERVVRGGSWAGFLGSAWAAFRVNYRADHRSFNIGLRPLLRKLASG